jgi:hypothetical protein
LHLHLIDNNGVPMEGVPSLDIQVYVEASGATSSPVKFVCQAESESTHVFTPEHLSESDGNGDLTLTLPALGGYDPAATWRVVVSGLEITGGQLQQAVRSVDINADGAVSLQDFVLFSQAYATEEWLADLDDDGEHTLSDRILFSSHYQHACGAGRGRQLTPGGPEPEEADWQVFNTTPNPFHTATSISFFTPISEERVAIRVYDLRGRLVRTLCDERFDAGIHTVMWDGRSTNGEEVASGVYFFQIDGPSGVERRKMARVR